MGYKVSVIVPIYQVEDYIRDSIESISRQTFKDYEVVLVNDGTTDDSVAIAEEVLKEHRIDYMVINQKNMGLAAARNSGIRNSSGEWIVCIDSDDFIREDFLKILYDGCLENNAKVSIANFQMVKNNKIHLTRKHTYNNIVFNKEDILYKFLIRNIKIIAPGMLVNKKLIVSNNLWYDEKIRFSEDLHLIWRLLFTVNRVVYNPSPIYNYLQRENSIMTSSNVKKILTGYYGFSSLVEELKTLNNDDRYYNYEIVKFILPRWVFGALRSAAKMLSLKNFIKLAEEMDYKKHMRELILFPDFKTRVLSELLVFNWKLFYIINNKF